MAVELTKKVLEYFLNRMTLFVSLIYVWFFLGIITGIILLHQEITWVAVIPLFIALIVYYNRAFSAVMFILFAIIFFLI